MRLRYCLGLHNYAVAVVLMPRVRKEPLRDEQEESDDSEESADDEDEEQEVVDNQEVDVASDTQREGEK